jgi:hypothetical protein
MRSVRNKVTGYVRYPPSRLLWVSSGSPLGLLWVTYPQSPYISPSLSLSVVRSFVSTYGTAYKMRMHLTQVQSNRYTRTHTIAHTGYVIGSLTTLLYPHCPDWLSPHVYRCPSRVSAAVWCPPHTTLITNRPSKAVTRHGNTRSHGGPRSLSPAKEVTTAASTVTRSTDTGRPNPEPSRPRTPTPAPSAPVPERVYLSSV